MASRPWRLLFVCTGNICRSPMAAEMARIDGGTRGLDIEAASGGTMGLDAHPADAHAISVCREIGLDLSGHRSRGLDPERLAWADRILVMELAHAQAVHERLPGLGERVALLGPFGGSHEIADPHGGWKFQYRWARDEIRKCVGGLLARLPMDPESASSPPTAVRSRR